MKQRETGEIELSFTHKEKLRLKQQVRRGVFEMTYKRDI